MDNYNQKNGGQGRFKGGAYGKMDGSRSFGGDNDSPEKAWNSANYQSKWIREGIDDIFPDFAEKIGKYIAENGLTSSKIRSIYGEIKRIQMGDFEKEKSSFFLLRPKVAYALGREKTNKGLQMFKIMFDACFVDVKDKASFLHFCDFLEAVLAYHKFYVKKDN